jgi:hypothetical protein
MNDPHVETLHYRIEHADDVDYKMAQPLECHLPAFRLRIQEDDVRITMLEHFATADDACAEVRPTLRAWELSAALDGQPGEFRFSFVKADVVDREPTPNTTHIVGAGFANVSLFGAEKVHISRSSYPPAPKDLALDERVETMFQAFLAHRGGRRSLSDAVYFCLTAVGGAGKQGDAARRFSIDPSVLRKISQLATTKGGSQARKFEGMPTDYTGRETVWLIAAMKLLIRRAAQVAAGSQALSKLTMADLPTLQDT